MTGSTQTLAGILNLPVRRQINYGHLPSPLMAKAITRTFTDCQPKLVAEKPKSEGAILTGQAHPNTEAAEFYALNQLVGVLYRHFTPNERLPDWAQLIAQKYQQTLLRQHQRLVHYMTLIVTRESRHMYNKSAVYKQHPKLFTVPMQEFMNSLPGDSTNAAKYFRTNAPMLEFGHYCRAIEMTFTGTFGGGYGGPPWRNIAKVLADYVEGKISGEMLIDTAYTLAHNNGPMFNKSMYYQLYADDLITLLDIQRSGQVCEFLIDPDFKGVSTLEQEEATALRELVKLVKSKVEGVGDYLDWYKVEELGSVNKYPHYKLQQDKKHPHKPKPINIGGQVMVASGEFEVLPGQKLTTYKRAA